MLGDAHSVPARKSERLLVLDPSFWLLDTLDGVRKSRDVLSFAIESTAFRPVICGSSLDYAIASGTYPFPNLIGSFLVAHPNNDLDLPSMSILFNGVLERATRLDELPGVRTVLSNCSVIPPEISTRVAVGFGDSITDELAAMALSGHEYDWTFACGPEGHETPLHTEVRIHGEIVDSDPPLARLPSPIDWNILADHFTGSAWVHVSYRDCWPNVEHAMEKFYFENYTEADREAYPFLPYKVGNVFASSVAECGLSGTEARIERVVRVATFITTNRNLDSLHIEPLSSVPDRASDGAHPMRARVTQGAPGHRLHYWLLPTGGIELSRVCLHDDMSIV